MDFQMLEEGIISALRAGVPELRAVESQAGGFDMDDMARRGRFPAAYVVYAGSEFSYVDGPAVREEASFRVLVAARNLRGGAAPRTGGGPQEPGAYALIMKVLGVLLNSDLGLQVEPLVLRRTALEHAGVTSVLYGLDFTGAFQNEYGT